MIWLLIIIAAALFVAYSNGANDNFKGVATLFGSGTTDYRKALVWATLTTGLGSLAACFFATNMMNTFSGKGLVPDEAISNPAFLASVILAAGLIVFAASKIGIPISTTHSLTGALMGSGLIAVGTQLGFTTLGKSFFIPLLASPLIALVLSTIVYFVMHRMRKALNITRQSCLCVGEKVIPLADLGLEDSQVMTSAEIKLPEIFIGNEKGCKARAVEIYEGNMFGVSAQSVLDFLHFISAGAVSFARGLNDTPKIVALLVASGALGLRWNIFLVAIVMAVGGILGARRVAETVSNRITYMNHGQGFTSNLVTAILVIFASRWGMPVSTTHVSCGSLFGIGLVNGKARWNVIGGIISAWILTLPASAVFAAGLYWMFQVLGAR